MVLYIKSPKKKSTRKIVQLINTFSKGAGYKTNTQKSLAFSYANDRLRKKPDTFHNSLKKYRGITNQPSERLAE